MKSKTRLNLSRRGFLRGSGGAAAAGSAFTIVRPELVRGAGRARLRAGIVGCGNRGSYTIYEFLGGNDDVELVAMGDLYKDRIERCLGLVRQRHPAVLPKMKVDPENMFTGFDAYRKVLASDIDVVLLVTPPVYRPLHFEAAVAARKHIFAEKPLGVDPVGVRRLMAAARKSEELKLTVVVGAQRRNQPEYIGTIEKIRHGAIGEIAALYAYWMGRPIVRLNEKPAGMGDVEFQTRNWYCYLWLSGGQVVEQHVHNIDVINWVMGTHPVKALASGGRCWRPLNEAHGDIYDHVSTEFEYANGVKFTSHGRHFPPECTSRIGEWVVGTKGRSNCMDLAPQGPLNPKVQEHVNFVKSIRGQGPYINMAMAVAESTMTGIMARESAYSGMEITWDMIMASRQELMPAGIENNPQLGVPPLPVPGEYRFR